MAFGTIAVCDNVVLDALVHICYFKSIEKRKYPMGLMEVIVDCESLSVCLAEELR